MKSILMSVTQLFIISILLISCGCASKNYQENKTKLSANGIWESIGHGYILQIKENTTYSFYDLTSISCLPQKKGQLEAIRKYLKIENDTLSITEPIISYKFIRIDKLPKLCQSPLDDKKANDPLYNFDVFMETVKEHYAFLELNKINWDELYSNQRAKLTANSTPADLYLTLEDTYEKLNDNHAFLNATDEVYEELDKLEEENETEEETGEELHKYGDFELSAMVAKHHLQEEMTKDSWLVNWGKMTDEIAYVQLKIMCLYADLDIPKALIDSVGYEDAFVIKRDKLYAGEYSEKEAEGASRIMDRIMKDLVGFNSIVIDVRFNGGGEDAVSLAILSHFNSDKLQIATHKFRYGDQHTSALPILVEGTKQAYTKPVYVLTSPQTGSAAEIFSLATMSMSNVKRIGSTTEGAMSTTLDKVLPNGWDFSISNEVYMDSKGKIYENKGIPVDYELNYIRGDRQGFFRSVANDLDADKQNILKAIAALKTR